MTLEDDLARVVDAFVDRMFDDFIIGFRFEGADRERVKRFELELARKHLLGLGSYGGRPIGPLHRAQRINAGQFRRRLALLQTVALEEGLDPDVLERWVAHDRKLERAITDGTDCVE
ncbi:MAG: hypothetical protein KC656_32305 [Myxococcales bacterium]|nr:hypothetical protein [Myxococcales bacterium]MCB9668058.1 hypothetical protein [Alphaproteobacteria bacterium]